MFQNADDAALELREIAAWQGGDGTVPEVAQRLVIEIGPARLRIMHWGRAVNDRGPPGFAGERRGFDRDLEKMLVLGPSDKPRADGLTGKLGLGFKSLLLACERPRLLSGKLAVEIVGGILPAPWTGAECNNARQALAGACDGAGHAGTLIELHGLAAGIRDDILGRFRTLAGVLCVFGKAIRHVELHRGGGAPDGALDPRAGWTPATIAPGIEVGQLAIADTNWGGATTSLCLRADSGSLLVALGPRGFRRLPDVVPAIWVTAPTRETTTVGFAINGAFDLDTGRARLADDNDANEERAKAIGTGVGLLVAQLVAMDWPTLREALGLEPNLSAHEFWHGLWLGLTEGWLRRQRDVAGKLVRAAVRALLRQLASRGAAVPNGLPAPFGQMIGKGQADYELARPLTSPEVVAVLAAWDRFTGQFPANRLLAPAIGEILKHAELAQPVPVGPAALLKLPTANQVEPADASVLGQIIELTAEQVPWDRGELRDVLRSLLFRTAADTWAEGRRLLTDAGRPGHDGDEERLRFAVAPTGCRLHGDYAAEPGGAAIQFFLDCRGRMEAPPQDLAQWVLMADETLQGAALRLLARSDSRGDIAPWVRGRGWLESVLNREGLFQAAQLTDADIDQLQRLLVSRDALSRVIQPDGNPPPDPSVRWAIDLRTGLERIFEWWAQERVIRGKAYRERLYPWEIAAKLKEGAESDEFDRSAWLTLFALGVFQSLQWPDDGRNRSFLEQCRDRGWWHTFAEVDPRDQPDKWMEIIEDYAKHQYDKEEWTLWIGQFPKLYRLARWLGEYVGLFRAIERFDRRFELNEIRRSMTSPVFYSGYEAPAIDRTLSHGAHLVIRELLHHGVLTKEHAVRHAYALTDPIKRLFAGFDETVTTPGDIYELLVKLLGDPAKARFHGDYDIPLRLVAGNDALRAEVLGQDW